MKKSPAVCDANVFIDIIKADLLLAFLNLPYEIFTSSFVIGEITDSIQLEIIQGAISSDSIKEVVFDSDEMQLLLNFYNTHKKQISLVDSSTLVLTKNLSAILLTGDLKLKKVAEADNITVRGTLFLMDEMVSKRLLNENDAIQRLETLLIINQRLPQKECFQLLEKWRRNKV